MAQKFIRLLLLLSILVASIFLPSGKAHALTGTSDRAALPALEEFVEQVQNGKADELRGVYVPEIFAASVVQQPLSADGFVSPWQNVLTEFRLASKLGSTGLLAHNYLAGEAFALLEPGQQIHLVFGDGRVSTFVVVARRRYQALEADSTSSAFRDLQTGSILKSSELFTNVYKQPGNVIFQTCITQDGNPTWGRLFVIAEPYED